MKFRLTVALACAGLTGCFQNWPKRDIALYSFNFACNAYDAYQTERAVENGYKELNPVLGESPSDERLIGIKVLGETVVYYLADSMEETRVLVLTLATVPCVYAVVHNYSEGSRP